MNEQLVVKNFGPIKDATVDFKRVTVFIGPTGGGKSTLAKLAATFKDVSNYLGAQNRFAESLLDYTINEFESKSSSLYWHTSAMSARLYAGRWQTGAEGEMAERMATVKEQTDNYGRELDELEALLNSSSINKEKILTRVRELLLLREKTVSFFKQTIAPNKPHYFPAERILLSTLGASWPDLIRDNVNLPDTLLDFAKQYLQARENIKNLYLPIFNVAYQYQEGKDTISILRGHQLTLAAAASGIQSVTPMLVLLEHLSRNTEQAQSFIIEEPELNLYPTAQQGLLNWLVEKCTKGENDLTITTHSPYILSHLNLLLYAYQVAEQHPDRAEEVDKIVPRASWINPAEFACYQVENGGVSSLVNAELGLIDNNGLDNLSGDAADAFDNLIRLSKAVALK